MMPQMLAAMMAAFLFALSSAPVSADVDPIARGIASNALRSSRGIGYDIQTHFGAICNGVSNDTAAFQRAAASGLPISIGPVTCLVSNFTAAGLSKFTLHGVEGVTTIKRASATGSDFFTVSATDIDIDGVVFDMNSANVTADQWGVQFKDYTHIVIKDSVFKNNSGTLGACLVLRNQGTAVQNSFSIVNINVTNCETLGAVYLASVTKGSLRSSLIHDTTGPGVVVQSYLTPTATNLSKDIWLSDLQVERTGGDGITVGGFGAPYDPSVNRAQNVTVANSRFLDNTGYAIALYGYDVAALDNTVYKSDASVVQYGGINCALSTRPVVRGNKVNVLGTLWGIDCGASNNSIIAYNEVTIDQGTAYNVGAQNISDVSHNRATVSGTGTAFAVYDTETDGNDVVMPTVAKSIKIVENTIVMSGGSTTGIRLHDNVGGVKLGGSASPVIVHNNHFVRSGGATIANDIIWAGQGSSLDIADNDDNGQTYQFVDPDANGDVIYDLVISGPRGRVFGLSNSTDVRSIIPRHFSNYGGGGSVFYVSPSAAGSNYTAATTISVTCSGSGPTGWAGTPMIYNGGIIGVRVTNPGTGCVGTPSASASDSGGGSGATFTAGNTPALPANSLMSFFSPTVRAMRSGGGFIGLTPAIPLQFMIGS